MNFEVSQHTTFSKKDLIIWVVLFFFKFFQAKISIVEFYVLGGLLLLVQLTFEKFFQTKTICVECYLLV